MEAKITRAMELAVKEFKRRHRQDATLEDGGEFVTVF